MRLKYAGVALSLLILYVVVLSSTALHPSPPPLQGNQQIVWVKDPLDHQVKPKLIASCDEQLFCIWHICLVIRRATNQCSGGGSAGGGGGVF